MNAEEAWESLRLKFTSANKYPVTRATILREEYEAIKKEYEAIKKEYKELKWMYEDLCK